MDTPQVCTLQRIGTWLALGLLVLSVGLMLLGWTVPRKAAFEAGVVGFQLFPVAILAVLLRIMLPLVLTTSLGRTFIGLVSRVVMSAATILWLRNPLPSSGNMAPDNKYRVRDQSKTRDNAVLDHILYRENPEIGINPLEYLPEDPLLRPKEYRLHYTDVFDDERLDL